MPQRLAAILALLAFAVCLYVGGFQAGNPFTTTVGRALAAMAGTYVVGLVVGSMGQRVIEENLAAPAAADAAAGTPPPCAVDSRPASGKVKYATPETTERPPSPGDGSPRPTPEIDSEPTDREHA